SGQPGRSGPGASDWCGRLDVFWSGTACGCWCLPHGLADNFYGLVALVDPADRADGHLCGFVLPGGPYLAAFRSLPAAGHDCLGPVVVLLVWQPAVSG